MSTAGVMRARDEMGALLAATGTEDESAFASLVERHRRELQVHCYRMLGSFEESEDLTQETFLRAWRGRAGFEGRSSVRAWLYRIATNACLDKLEQNPRSAPAAAAAAPARASEITWLQPYPDELLEGIVSSEAGPEDAVVAKETIELAFLVAIQHLAPQPRAVLILRDVLGWSAKDTAESLDVSVATVTSALQRARAAMKEHLPERRLEWAPGSDASEEQRLLLQRYIEATESADVNALGAMLSDDARFSMPPHPGYYVGRDVVVRSWVDGGFGSEAFGEFRCVATAANRQPAVACYVRRGDDPDYRALALDVLRIEAGAVAEITTFTPAVFPAFGLPEKL